MKNHEKFLYLCNTLTRNLSDRYHLKQNATMGYAIRETRYKNPVIKYHYDALISYVELRNVLVHESYDRVLAEPTLEVINHLTHIVSKISEAKKVKDMFLFDVVCFYENDLIESLFETIQKTKYSHFPIFNNGGLLGIISANGIAHFIASKIGEDIISLKDIRILEVLQADEHSNHFKMITSMTPLYDIIDIFDSRQHPVMVTLISDQKEIRNPKDILGFILPKDVAYVMDFMF